MKKIRIFNSRNTVIFFLQVIAIYLIMLGNLRPNDVAQTIFSPLDVPSVTPFFFFRNTQSWHYCNFCVTSSVNKLEIIVNQINSGLDLNFLTAD